MEKRQLLEAYLESSRIWWGIFIPLVLASATALYLHYFEFALALIVITLLHVLVRLAHRMRKIAKDIILVQTLGQLIEKYLAFMAVALLLFTILYSIADATHAGYITYDECSDQYAYGSVTPSHSFFYFSAVTMFTVGYGDVCPMGVSKGIAVLNMLVGNMFTVVFIGAAIGNLASKKN